MRLIGGVALNFVARRLATMATAVSERFHFITEIMSRHMLKIHN